MRPPRIQRSVLRYPVDEMLGVPSNVRLLRVLIHDTRAAVSVTDAARLAGLTATGARRALENLERLGIVSTVGSGHVLKYATVPGNPFLPVLAALFTAERQEYDELIDTLRHAVAMPEVQSAWLEDLPAGVDGVIELHVLVSAKVADWIGNEVRSRLLEMERRWNRIVEINVVTRADEPDIPDSSLVLWNSGERSAGMHRVKEDSSLSAEERSLMLAQAVSDLVRKDPSLVSRTLRYLDKLLREGQGTANADLREWKQLLETYSTGRLRDLLLSDSSRARRLRRSMPFLAVLTPDEREIIFKRTEARR